VEALIRPTHQPLAEEYDASIQPRGVFLPSASWLVGFRTATGVEFAIGPNLTPISFSLAMAGGITYHVGALNVPVNLAIVPSQAGMRVSVLTGFNMGR
jgi:hypothetical protein